MSQFGADYPSAFQFGGGDDGGGGGGDDGNREAVETKTRQTRQRANFGQGHEADACEYYTQHS